MNKTVLRKVKKILEKEPRLIEIKRAEKIVFVGDTHGDLEASQKIIKDYLMPQSKIVFLGDYVDRGLYSKENLDFLLKKKLEFPNQIFLLQGNHEGHRVLSFSPADFWESLSEREYKKYCSIVEKFSLVVTAKNIIALHGVLPDVKNLEKINEIELGNKEWFQITWGDFIEQSGEFLGINSLSGRPEFGKDWFLKLMTRFDKKILIRSHQLDAPQFMFSNKCLTIFTSSAYPRERTIAVVDFSKEIKTAKDFQILKI